MKSRVKLVFFAVIAAALLFFIPACQTSETGSFLVIDSHANIEMHRGQFRVFSATIDGRPAANAEWTIRGTLPVNEFTTVVDGLLFIAYGELNNILELEVVSGRESLRISVNVLDTVAHVNLPEAFIVPWQGRFDIAAGSMTSLNAEYFGGWIDWKWEIAGEPHAGIGIVGSQLVVFPGTPEVTAMVRAFDPDNPDKAAYATFTVREPEITGVIVEGSAVYRGEEHSFIADIARSGPVVSAECPIWEWSVVTPSSALHDDTGFRDGQWGDRVLFIHEDEAAETITIRATDLVSGRYGDREVLIQDKLVPFITLSPSGFIEVARGESRLFEATVNLPDGLVYDDVSWFHSGLGMWPLHPDTLLVGVPDPNNPLIFDPNNPSTWDPLARNLQVSLFEAEDVVIVTVMIDGQQLLGVAPALLYASVFVTVVDP